MTTETEFSFVELALIVPSLTNSRQNFNPAKLTELAESIKASGVHQPILLRPLPGSRVEETSWNSEHGQQLTRRAVRPIYEVVAGERRYRASIEAGVSTIPALVRPLTDDQVLEIQIVENLQRDDLTELEEAQGYEQLMTTSKLTVDQVGAKICKSRSYVYTRLKLLDLSAECKQALRLGEIDYSRALLIARIPDSKLQLRALEEATRKDYFGVVDSVREFQHWLQQNVMLRLDNAPFKITDTRLVSEAGSCKTCPKRTGANPDLFSDTEGADLCTDPACFNEKTQVHHDIMVAKAEAKGLRFVEGKEAKGIVHQYTNALRGYSPLSQVREDLIKDAPSNTLGKLLGKDAPAPVLIENPWTKELIEAVPTAEAEAVLLAKGLIASSPAEKTSKEDLAFQQEQIKKKATTNTQRELRHATYAALCDAIRALPDDEVGSLITPNVMRAWLLAAAENLDQEDMADALNITLPEEESYEDSNVRVKLALQACSGADVMRAVAILMIQENRAYFEYDKDKDQPADIFLAVTKQLGLDLSAVHGEAIAKVKAETAEKLRALKEKYAPKTAKPVAKSAKAPAKKKGKLSPEETMDQIAEAFQADDDQAGHDDADELEDEAA